MRFLAFYVNSLFFILNISMFESATYSNNCSYSSNTQFVISTSLSSSFKSTVSAPAASPISVRTSDKTFQSYSSGANWFDTPNNTFFTRKTGSFVDIHSEIETGITLFSEETRPEEDDSTGQLNKENVSPVGDMLLPLLALAAIYAVVRFFKQRKAAKHATTNNNNLCVDQK